LTDKQIEALNLVDKMCASETFCLSMELKPGDLEIEPEDVKDRTLIRTVLQHDVVSMADFK
jgi:hypothetical protein